MSSLGLFIVVSRTTLFTTMFTLIVFIDAYRVSF